MSANRNVAVEGSGSVGRFGSCSVTAVEDVDKWADFKVLEEGMAEVAVAVDLIAVASPDLGPVDVAPGDQFGDDPLGGSFGNSDAFGDVTRAGVRVAGDA
jgi:hypothetical protein